MSAATRAAGRNACSRAGQRFAANLSVATKSSRFVELNVVLLIEKVAEVSPGTMGQAKRRDVELVTGNANKKKDKPYLKDACLSAHSSSESTSKRESTL